jgi:hypothetical protein
MATHEGRVSPAARGCTAWIALERLTGQILALGELGGSEFVFGEF